MLIKISNLSLNKIVSYPTLNIEDSKVTMKVPYLAVKKNSKFLGKSAHHTRFDGQCIYHEENETKGRKV